MKVQFFNATTREVVKPEVIGNFTEVSEAFNSFMAECAVAHGLNGGHLSVRDAMPGPGLIVRTMSDGHEVRIYTDMYVEPCVLNIVDPRETP